MSLCYTTTTGESASSPLLKLKVTAYKQSYVKMHFCPTAHYLSKLKWVFVVLFRKRRSVRREKIKISGVAKWN